MNFTDFVSAGVAMLADFDRDVAMAAGLSTGRVRDLARVHHTYSVSYTHLTLPTIYSV